MGAKTKKQVAKAMAKRQAKAGRMTDKGGTKSPYAQKLRRKAGRGRPEARWMWWLERGEETGVTSEEASDVERVAADG
jgi:hypothetical protein